MTQALCKPVTFSFVCCLESGLHARPASQIAELASSFAADCCLVNVRTGLAVNLKSTLAIISAEIRNGDECSMRISGPDEDAAMSAISHLITHKLPRTEEPPTKLGKQHRNIPRSLLATGAECHVGLPGSPGIGRGKLVVVPGLKLRADLASMQSASVQGEETRIRAAMEAVDTKIKEMRDRASSPVEAEVLNAHLAILQDVSLSQSVYRLISQGRNAQQAIVETAELFASVLEQSESALVRERALDVREVCGHVLEQLGGAATPGDAKIKLGQPSVVVAESLAPQQLLNMDRRFLCGLVLERAGSSSHTLILARALGIPAVAGLENASRLFAAESELVVDGSRGLVISTNTPEVQRYYDREQRVMQRQQQAVTAIVQSDAVTRDGQRMKVAVNVSSSDEVPGALRAGAEGVGLFRSEMLLIGRNRVLSEQDQFEIYKQAALLLDGRPLILRTFDIGGDKPVANLKLPAETNPFLGFRGIRIYPEYLQLLRDQLRAILRASAFGRIQIMAPMVSVIDEAGWFRRQIDEVSDELQREHIAFDASVPVGAMIEVPSAAFMIDELCADLDFFSIGTNDLIQYFLAADRDNPKVARLSTVYQPSFLRFLKQIVDAVHAKGKPIAMCGEMAGDLRSLPILIGLGLDEISASAANLSKLKLRISGSSAQASKELLACALGANDAEQVIELLDHSRGHERPEPLLHPNLILVRSDSQSREEAIRELVGALYVMNRTEDADGLEQAVWERELASSTGLGHGFAIPHCRSDAVEANSIALLKLSDPIHWGSVDDQPVQTLILLALRSTEAADSHIKVFARLARKLMNHKFRDALNALQDAHSICNFLAAELEVSLPEQNSQFNKQSQTIDLTEKR